MKAPPAENVSGTLLKQRRFWNVSGTVADDGRKTLLVRFRGMREV